MKKLVTFISLLFFVPSLLMAQITIDGDMSDWLPSMQVDRSPCPVEGIGDSIDVNWDGVKDGVINPALDVKDIYITHDDDYLYVRLDINEDGTFTDLESMVDGGYQAALEIFLDTDVDPSTGLTWGWWLTSGDYWINLSVKRGWPGFELSADYGILKFVGQNGSDSQWEEVEGASCLVAANLDDNKLEVAIPRAAIGEINGELESTGILILGEDPTAGWNADLVPNNLGSERIVYRYGKGQIYIDGDMSDWTADMQFDVLPRYEEEIGDSIDANWDGVKDGVINPALDVQDIYVTHDDDYLYVRLDINEDGTFTDLESMVDGGYQAALEIFLDTDVSPTTGLTWGWWLTSGDYWINLSVKRGWPGFELSVDYGIMKFIGQNGSDSQWEEVEGASCLVATNLDDNKLEVAIPRAAIGETNGELESTGILILGEDPTAGWNADVVPNDLGGTPSVYRYGRTQITIDGDMSDWTADMQFDVLPRYEEEIGDSIDANWDGVKDGVINPALDVKDIYVTHDDDYLYVRLDINEDGTFTDLESMVDGGYQAALEIFLDTDVDPSTGLTWGWWMTSGDYWINLSVKRGWPGFELSVDYGIMKFVGQNGSDSQWEEVEGASCLVATNLDDNKLEVAIPRAAIGETNGELESTGILILGEDPTAGWNADVVPNDLGGTPSVYRYGNQATYVDSKTDVVLESFSLEQNYPNPFNPRTNIKFTLAKRTKVSLKVFNMLGQQVATLLSNQDFNAGVQTVEFDGSNLSSGMYIYVIEADGFVGAKKMMLLK